jgi:hypothetical protein
MLAVAWPFGFPARFAATSGAQTRYAQTLRAFSPVPAALLGHTTRPEETAQTLSRLLRADQLDEPVLSRRHHTSFAEGLRQGPPDESVRPDGGAASIGPQVL